nr:hypothetical protein BCU54_15400 [Vibrio lentus]
MVLIFNNSNWEVVIILKSTLYKVWGYKKENKSFVLGVKKMHVIIECLVNIQSQIIFTRNINN